MTDQPNLEQRLAQIRRLCFLFAVTAIILYGLAFGYFWFFGKILDPLTSIFQFLLIVAWCGIMLPYFMRMEAKTDYGLRQNKEISEALSPLGPLIKKASAQLDEISDSKMREDLKSKFREIVDHMAAIREKIANDKQDRVGVKHREKIEKSPGPVQPSPSDGRPQAAVPLQGSDQDLPKSE